MQKKVTIITNSIICSVLLVLGFFVFNLDVGKTYLSITAPLYNGDRTTNKIGLMFIVDNNEVANNLPEIIKALSESKSGATFFISGSTAVSNLEITKQLGNEFELGNYGFSNIPLNISNRTVISDEINICGSLIKSFTDKNMNLFTPPNSLFNKTTLGIASNLGYKTVLPTVRKVSIDWKTADTNLVSAYATHDTKAGDIIMLRPEIATMQCISKIISNFLERDLTITSVGNLLDCAV